jgi:hypothetical protein
MTMRTLIKGVIVLFWIPCFIIGYVIRFAQEGIQAGYTQARIHSTNLEGE